MANRKRCKHPALSSKAVESRAGLIPESDYIQIEKCHQNRNLASIKDFLKNYLKTFRHAPEESSLENLLAYLRLYSDRKGYDFDHIIATSYEMYFDDGDLQQTYN